MEISIGEKLKELRQKKHYTQEYVANYIGRTKSFVCMYESAKRVPGRNTLIKLSQLFDVSLDYLIGQEQEHVYYNSLKEDTALDYKNYPIIPMYESVSDFFSDEVLAHASPANLLPDHEDENDVFYIALDTEQGRGWALVTRNSKNEDSEHYIAVKNGKAVIISKNDKIMYNDDDILGRVRSITYLL